MLGALLRGIEQQQRKSCDTDAGGCNAPNHVKQELLRPAPRVFTLQLAWESQHESGVDILATLSAVQEVRDQPSPWCLNPSGDTRTYDCFVSSVMCCQHHRDADDTTPQLGMSTCI